MFNFCVKRKTWPLVSRDCYELYECVQSRNKGVGHTPVSCGTCSCSWHVSFLLQLPVACFGWVSSFPFPLIWRESISWYLWASPLSSLLSLFYHTSVMNFISYLYGILCLSPALCSVFGFLLGMKTSRQQFCSSLFLFQQPSSSVYRLWRRTTLNCLQCHP